MKDIKLITYVEDNELYISIVEAAINMSDEFFNFKSFKFSDDAERDYISVKDSENKPAVIFVDINLLGSTYDGIEFIRKINFELGNNTIIGVLSSSSDEIEKAKAKKAGAMFWIHKDRELLDVIPEFLKDLTKFENREILWKEY